MDAPLFNTIKAITGYPMHMPGHKRNFAPVPLHIMDMDITEIAGSDNLHEPHGVIKQAQEKMARVYGCDESIFCVNGGSSGILAAVLGTCAQGDTLLAVKNAHKSLNNALVLSGAGVIYTDSGTSPYGFALPAKADDIARALDNHPEIKAVFIVSPTYEGFCADVKAIAEQTHKRGKILIVDETHGAHFPFGKSFPENAARQGADISVTSWHKTMPVPNQCALININKSRVDISRIKQAFSMVTTTSPSYIFMGLMDYVRAYCEENPEFFSNYEKKMIEIRQRLAGLKNLRLADTAIRGYGYDISKLTFLSDCEYCGEELSRIFAEKYGFVLEMAGEDHIIAMTSPADDMQMLDKFADAAAETDAASSPKNRKKAYEKRPLSKLIVQRDIFYAPKTLIPLEEAAGMTAAEHITPFPPDIPCILAGETIEECDTARVKALMDAGIEVMGIKDGKIQVLLKEQQK